MSIVPSPTQFPNCCLFCQSQKGPMWYGGTVTAAALAAYACRTCAETIAREFGLTEGEEMDRLRGAAEELAQKEKEAEAHAEEMVKAAGSLAAAVAQVNRLEDELDAERGKVATMEHAAADVRQAVGTLAGVGVPLSSGVVMPDGRAHEDSDPED